MTRMTRSTRMTRMTRMTRRTRRTRRTRMTRMTQTTHTTKDAALSVGVVCLVCLGLALALRLHLSIGLHCQHGITRVSWTKTGRWQKSVFKCSQMFAVCRDQIHSTQIFFATPAIHMCDWRTSYSPDKNMELAARKRKTIALCDCLCMQLAACIRSKSSWAITCTPVFAVLLASQKAT